MNGWRGWRVAACRIDEKNKDTSHGSGKKKLREIDVDNSVSPAFPIHDLMNPKKMINPQRKRRRRSDKSPKRWTNLQSVSL